MHSLLYMGNQGKKIGFLCLLLVVSGGWIALASRQGGDVGGQSADPIRRPSSFLSDPNLPSSPGIHLGNGELFLRMMLSVGLVIALGAAALYVSKKVLPGVAQRGGKEIHVLETAYLGPRKALHLVEVGNQRLLVASTNDSITMLAPVNEAWLGAPNAEGRVGEPLEAAQPELDQAVKP
ncbi:MAG: flagellar biosynthetic protein FliO [Phycisphaerae bacterium]|nr:flagellar biosynthetic protein FliO [Phycisphaerae bacterium]